MLKKILSVSELNAYIRALLEDDALLSGLLIQGELSNFKAHSSGHWYFTLKDASAAIQCVMFRAYASMVPFVPASGMKVILVGRVSLYEKTGAYQFYAEAMEPAGKGALALAFEQRKIQLEKEGLFDARFKKPIPFFPKCAAIITSLTGAALRDVIQIARRRNPHVALTAVPALVQGEEAAASIAAALRLTNEWGGADVIILARGGGSLEDLWPFNEEIVARAIFASRIPVISAVGHETDFTIADFTADLRAPTPSAAAELAIPNGAALRGMLLGKARGLNDIFWQKWSRRYERLALLREKAVLSRPLEGFQQKKVNVRALLVKLDQSLAREMEKRKWRAEARAAVLENLSPFKILHRGYALALDGESRPIASAADLSQGQYIKLKFWDGQVDAMITGEKYGEEKTEL
ncbi:MAG: exodeoxyribonuclease VII large subunit [Clostridiales bacterium]|jgi:exodeoxyribonuclease VII large subunit|nr:exodeoxyribonuclease VII large subunit [Clostridiales bacterium]